MFLQSADGQTRSVLVELDAPSPKLAFDRGLEGSRAIGFAAASPEDEQAQNERAQALSDLLTGVIGGQPRYLRAAKAFVVEVTPRQLERVLDSDLVRAVRENRRLTR